MLSIKILLISCFYLKSLAEYSCPIRIISNNAHSSSSVEDEDPGSLMTEDLESDVLPEGGENLQPLANNTGFISSDQSIRKNYKW